MLGAWRLTHRPTLFLSSSRVKRVTFYTIVLQSSNIGSSSSNSNGRRSSSAGQFSRYAGWAARFTAVDQGNLHGTERRDGANSSPHNDDIIRSNSRTNSNSRKSSSGCL